VITPDTTVLLTLAGSIADGSAVDWDAVEAAAGEEDRAVIRQLRILSSVAGLHRTLPAVADTQALAVSPIADSAPAPRIGRWGHLELIERLGAGAYGDVYRAWDPQLEREVALKLLRTDGTSDDLPTSRIATEGRLLARVRHPHVITVHGVASHDGRVGLWMDLVRGVTLEQRLDAHGAFSASEAALVGIDVCRALAAIHAAGLLHRDVKAQNVMREDGGRVVLMDLGTGRAVDRDGGRPLSDVAGTPLYLAPELFAGAAASERSDVYSLGVLLYHLVTGAFPVRAVTIEQLREGHVNGGAVMLRDARADLPTGFVQVIDRAIAADPAQRYATVGAVEGALANALGGATRDLAREGPPPARRSRWQQWGLVAVIASLALVGAWGWLRPRPAPIRSVVVLPFANASGNTDSDYLSDGITDALINSLSTLNSVRVVPRSLAFTYKGSTADLLAIARTLKVGAVVTGRLTKRGDRLEVAAEMMDVATVAQIWGDRYTRTMSDVFALQDDVARDIAKHLRVKLTKEEDSRLVKRGTTNTDAYQLYLRGIFDYNTNSQAGYAASTRYFTQAIALDPQFAAAHVALARAYASVGRTTPEQYRLSKSEALRALELDDTSGGAHFVLGAVRHLGEHDDVGAEREFRLGLALEPDVDLIAFGSFLLSVSHFDEALSEMKRVIAVNPTRLLNVQTYSLALLAAGHPDQAIAEAQRGVDLDRRSGGAYRFLGTVSSLAGRSSAALQAFEQGVQLGDVNSRAGVVGAYARLGRMADASKELPPIRALVQHPRQWDFSLAMMYADLGTFDEAFEALDRLLDNPELSALAVIGMLPAIPPPSPAIARFVRDARFADFHRRLHQPAPAS
jgi:serine/threonine protein kinase/tetratricopeptide (TPR) repeat protein